MMKKWMFGFALALGLMSVKPAHAELRGNLDQVDCTGVAGWAWDTNLASPVRVDIFVDNTLRYPILADNFRPDLLAAGIGNGDHSFNIVDSSITFLHIQDGFPHSVDARVNGVSLWSSPKTVQCGGTVNLGPVRGNLDVVDCNQIAGWAWYENSSTAALVEVRVDNASYETVSANQFRPDLLAAGIGNGDHSFSVTTPPQVQDGSVHSIDTRVNGVSISNSPKTVQCGGAALGPVQGNLDVVDCNQIAGWAWYMNSSTTALVEIRVDNASYETVPAFQFRPDLLAAGIGNGYHSFNVPTPSQVQDGATHSIDTRVNGVSISNSPKTVQCAVNDCWDIYFQLNPYVNGGFTDGNAYTSSCSAGNAFELNDPPTPHFIQYTPAGNATVRLDTSGVPVSASASFNQVQVSSGIPAFSFNLSVQGLSPCYPGATTCYQKYSATSDLNLNNQNTSGTYSGIVQVIHRPDLNK